jgi:hypothetical protein
MVRLLSMSKSEDRTVAVGDFGWQLVARTQQRAKSMDLVIMVMCESPNENKISYRRSAAR